MTKHGVVSQREYFKKQVASYDNTGYLVVRKGQLVFGTLNLWQGSLEVLKQFDVGIVSPAYRVFSLNQDYCDVDFMSYYLKSDEMLHRYVMHSEQGASIVRRNLDLRALLNDEVILPTLEEQRRIANVLNSADDVTKRIRQRVDKLKDLKTALMQVLLTKGVNHLKNIANLDDLTDLESAEQSSTGSRGHGVTGSRGH